MRLSRKPLFPRRYRKSGRPRLARRFLLFGAVLLLGWLLLSELGLSSVSQELAEEALRARLVESVHAAANEAMEDRESSYIQISRDEAGQVVSIAADTPALNRLRVRMLEELEQQLERKARAQVSLGSLFGLRIFNGRGPKIPIRLDVEGFADVEFTTEFASAGLNQSCYRVLMTVDARAHSQSLRFEAAAQTRTQLVLEETVIVGEVPNWSYQEGT